MAAESTALTWLADGLILLGLLILSIAVYGTLRLPDVYTRLHAASMAGFMGIVPFLVAAATTGVPAIIFRVILIAVFLLLTTTVATRALAHAAYMRGEGQEPSRRPDQPEARVDSAMPGLRTTDARTIE